MQSLGAAGTPELRCSRPQMYTGRSPHTSVNRTGFGWIPPPETSPRVAPAKVLGSRAVRSLYGFTFTDLGLVFLLAVLKALCLVCNRWRAKTFEDQAGIQRPRALTWC